MGEGLRAMRLAFVAGVEKLAFKASAIPVSPKSTPTQCESSLPLT